uniref:HPP transmembrane region domain-containing protein n=1 Tax=Kalanchoe fedtschenkoi TaxID=63787 RepID=A0A7N1A6P1_KALFE
MALQVVTSHLHRDVTLSSASPSALLVAPATRPTQIRQRTILRATKTSPGFFNPLAFRIGQVKRREFGVVASSNAAASQPWEAFTPDKASAAPSLSDVFWPSAGAFVAMAVLGKVDQLLAPKGISMTIAPLGAVCAVLFTTPASPAARKYNMFLAQIGCAAIGVVAYTVFGPGWLARSAGLAAAIGFMIYTRSNHPPAASLPLLFIDGVKLHHLNYWYALFPGAASCIFLCLLQEIVCYLKANFKF